MPMFNKKEQNKKSIFFIFPMLIVLLAMGMNDILFSPVNSNVGVSFTSDPRRLIVLGTAYLMGLLAFFRYFKDMFFVLKKEIIYILFLLYCLLSSFWSENPINVVINFGHYVGGMLVVLAAVNYFKDEQDKCFRFFAVVLAGVLLVSIIVSILLPSIGIHVITGRWQGVTGNPNTLGVLCILSIWANTSDVFIRKKLNWQSLCLFGISIVALAGARSTTSFVVSFFCVVGIWFLCSIQNKSKVIKTFIYMCISWSGILFFMGIFLVKPEVLSLDGSLALVGKDSTFTGRTDIWAIAIEAISMKPYCGWSFDSNRSALDFFNFSRGQFHNGYLDLIVRGGYISMLFFIIVILESFYRIKKLSTYKYRESISWLVLLGCFLVHNLTEASILRETHVFWLFIVFFLCIMPSYSVKPEK